MARPVVVCNVFPDDNKGGCAITLQTIAWLKRAFPESPVYIVPVEQSGTYQTDQHRFTLGRYPDVKIVRSPIRTDGATRTTLSMLVRSFVMLIRRSHGDSEFERVIAAAAIVVSKGGYVFVERNTLRNLLGLWFTAFPLSYAARLKVPTVVLCSTVGPFRRALSRVLSRWILSRVDAVVTRDPISTAEARRLGRVDAIECPDIALTFDREAIDSRYFRSELSAIGRYGVVVLSGETPQENAIFLERIRSLSKRILDDGLVDRVVVTIQSLEDSPITSRFVELVDDARVLSIEDDLSPEELMGIYREARFLIGRRMHGGLFAMLSGTPVVLFAKDGVKTDGVMGALGLSSRVVPYPEFSVDDVHRLLVLLLNRGPEEKGEIAGRILEARGRAMEVLRALASRFQLRAEPSAAAKERIA